MKPVRLTVRRGRRVLAFELDALVEDDAGRPLAAVVHAADDPPPGMLIRRTAAAARTRGVPWLVVRTPAGTLAIDVEALAARDPDGLERALVAGETLWDFDGAADPGAGAAAGAATGWWHLGLRHPRPVRAGELLTIQVGGPPPTEAPAEAGSRGGAPSRSGPAPRLLYTLDGSFPEPGAPASREAAFRWQGSLWQATVPPAPAGTRIRYRIALPGGTWLEEGPPVDAGGHPVPHRGPCHACLVEPGEPPAWARDTLIYHVFVDRFARAGGWPFEAEASGPLPEAALWDFVGGNLAGVRERLDHIAGLGCTAVWLSPVFQGTAYHGYHVTDLRDVDPRFGSLAELRALVAEAHARGLRVLLDFVPNHVGRLHPAFLAAQARPCAPERRAFLFDRWPDRYATFLGVQELPKLNNDDPATREATIAAARFWLEDVGLDGLRLDHANGLSHDAWVAFRAAIKRTRPDALLLAEVWDAPAGWQPYLGEFDAVFDFATVWSLRDALATGAKPLSELDQDLDYLDARFGEAPLLLCRFLDNHDMDRFLQEAGGDVAALRLAAALLYALSGPICLSYGTEVGLGQRRPCFDPATGELHFEYAREPFPWRAWDAGEPAMRALYAAFARLGGARRRFAALSRGRRRTVLATEDLYAFWKVLDGAEPVLVAINRSEAPQAIRVPRADQGGAGPMERVVPPRTALWLLADGTTVAGQG